MKTRALDDEWVSYPEYYFLITLGGGNIETHSFDPAPI